MSKRVIIPRGDLPNPEGQTFYVRFRIVSQDRNRVSAWTPIFEVTSEYAYVQPTNGFVSDILATQVFS